MSRSVTNPCLPSPWKRSCTWTAGPDEFRVIRLSSPVPATTTDGFLFPKVDLPECIRHSSNWAVYEMVPMINLPPLSRDYRMRGRFVPLLNQVPKRVVRLHLPAATLVQALESSLTPEEMAQISAEKSCHAGSDHDHYPCLPYWPGGACNPCCCKAPPMHVGCCCANASQPV